VDHENIPGDVFELAGVSDCGGVDGPSSEDGFQAGSRDSAGVAGGGGVDERASGGCFTMSLCRLGIHRAFSSGNLVLKRSRLAKKSCYYLIYVQQLGDLADFKCNQLGRAAGD
jgi:hypothetical protein